MNIIEEIQNKIEKSDWTKLIKDENKIIHNAK